MKYFLNDGTQNMIINHHQQHFEVNQTFWKVIWQYILRDTQNYNSQFSSSSSGNVSQRNNPKQGNNYKQRKY